MTNITGSNFTGLNTRTTHLEMAVNLTTIDFVQVFWRFYAIPGYPEVSLSNNGSQMVGVEMKC